MKRSRITSLLQVLVHIVLLRPWVRLFFGLNVIGRENLSHLDRFILIANHNSHLDIFLLFCLLPVRLIPRTHPVADKTYFSRSRIVFLVAKFLFDPVWVVRGKPDTGGDPLDEIKTVLEEGCNLIIFPEGTRRAPGAKPDYKVGVVLLYRGHW